jgi:hypothetical protein
MGTADRPPVHCPWCASDTEPEHWAWQKDVRYKIGGRWKCRELKRADGRRYMTKKRNDPIRGVEHKEYAREYAKRNAHWARVKAYRYIDKKRGRASITWDEAKPLMQLPCTYCGIEVSGGLDRIDNELGHEVTNVRPCCWTCNCILGDLPVEAKDLLADGLRAAREGGHLNQWLPPHSRSRA